MTKVYLKLSHQHIKAISRQPVSKLNPKFYGPFLVLAKVGLVAYRLQLSEGAWMHPVFHVSLLKKSMGPQVANPSLPPSLQEEAEPTAPIAILDRCVIYKQGAPIIQVLVKWSSLHLDNNTWEYLPDLLKQFPTTASLLHISWGQEMFEEGEKMSRT